MKTGFESCEVEHLKTHALNLKNTLERLAHMTPEERHRPLGAHGDRTSAFESSQLTIVILASVEAELWRRGVDPRTPEFGFDWMGLYEEEVAKREQLQPGRSA